MTIGEGITIGSFLVLAGLTWWYAHQTKKLADQAQASTEAARRSAESSERMVQLESLPIVWGRIEKVTLSSTKGALLGVAARNVGRAVALNVEFWLFIDGELNGPVLMGRALDPVVGEGTGELTVPSSDFLGPDGDYAVICSYEDAASRRYQTRAMKDDAHILEITSDGERRLLAD